MRTTMTIKLLIFSYTKHTSAQHDYTDRGEKLNHYYCLVKINYCLSTTGMNK